MKILQLIVLQAIIFSFATPVAAFDLFGGDGDETEIWRSKEKFIKLEKQYASSEKAGPNDHPVELDPAKVTQALSIIEFFEKGGFFSRDKQNFIFSGGQANILGIRIAEGLRKAGPNQDLTFALAKLEALAMGMKDRVYTAGRIFYKDNRLNIIIGDFYRPRDKAMEQAAASAGKSVDEFTYVFDTGRRFRNKKRDFNVITGNGIEVKEVGGRIQRDWIVVNLDQAAAYYAELQDRNDPNRKALEREKALEAEAARVAQERRELRMEMARMRKEMQELSENGGGGSNADSRSVQDRMSTLDDLLDQGLISKEEYEAKRQEILNEI